MYSCQLGESSGSSNQMKLAIESKPNLALYSPPSCFDPSGSSMERTSHATSIEEIIENSQPHWSHLGDFDSNNEVAEVSNMELFKTLQAHPSWGSFFKNFGKGFWRAPETLEACKHGNVNTKPKLFIKAVDVYSYGMTCYEILTSKLPFEGHAWRDYDLVLQGQRPEVPNYVDGWIRHLLNRCWQSNPGARPSSQEILKILQVNSIVCRNCDLQIQKFEVKDNITKALEYRDSKFVEMWRSLRLKLRLPKLKRPSSCRKCLEC